MRDPQTIRDQLLVVRCQLGEAGAFDELVARWHPQLWTYLRRLLPDRQSAEDATQDVWVRILRGLPRLADPSRFPAWAFRIARNVLMDRLRHQYRDAAALGSVIDAELHADPLEPVLEEELRDLRNGLARLPAIEREALTLYYLRDLTLDEIAQVLDVPVGTVKSRLHRARASLRTELTAASSTPGGTA